MKEYKATANKTDRLKWGIYILLGIGLLVYVLIFSGWDLISKLVAAVILCLNLGFDIFYFIQSRYVVFAIHFDDTGITLIDSATNQQFLYTDLKYSIRKKGSDTHKTEIELKTESRFDFKTRARLHIKNWRNISDIEKELEVHEVERVQWKPLTLWGKNWGIFVDLIAIALGADHTAASDLHEEIIERETNNPIKEKKE